MLKKTIAKIHKAVDDLEIVEGGWYAIHDARDKYRINVVLVYGKNPVGPRGGTSGNWVDGVMVFKGRSFLDDQMQLAVKELLTRIFREGTGDDVARAFDAMETWKISPMILRKRSL